MKAGRFFTFEELTASDKADELGIENQPDDEQRVALVYLVAGLLDPLRLLLQQPVVISSGFRCGNLNRKVGGSEKSQHTRGEAADIVVSGMTPTELARAVIDFAIPFDQLIAYPQRGIVHLSLTRHRDNRRQVLTDLDDGHGPRIGLRGG